MDDEIARMGWERFDAMRLDGVAPPDTYRAARSHGMDVVRAIKMLRALYGLNLADAKAAQFFADLGFESDSAKGARWWELCITEVVLDAEAVESDSVVVTTQPTVPASLRTCAEKSRIFVRSVDPAVVHRRLLDVDEYRRGQSLGPRRAAILAGLAYALRRVPGHWRVTVHEIVGLLYGPTPTVAGYAAIQALYTATGQALPPADDARLKDFVCRTGDDHLGDVPDFESLRWVPLDDAGPAQ